MNKLSIKVKISDREYPMKVDSADEENIRRAGKIINERLRSYREKFGIDDKQDLLAMVAFDSTVEKLKVEGKSHQVDDTIEHKLAKLNPFGIAASTMNTAVAPEPETKSQPRGSNLGEGSVKVAL